jgi:hypothetical protein
VPSQLHERVGKWTHEPRSNLNHKKHLSDTFICTFIFSTKLFRKYKNIFTSLHTHTKSKNIITASYLLYCIVKLRASSTSLWENCLNLYRTTYCILFLLTFTSYAWQPLGGVGDTITRNLFCRLLEEERQELLRRFPEFPRGKNLLLL